MLQNAIEYVRAQPAKPWLLLGKGPSLDWACRHDLDTYNVFSLNHACRIYKKVAVAHFTDWSAFLDCGDYLAENEIVTCLPWYPHRDNVPGTTTLLEAAKLFRHYPHLAWLLAKSLLLTYNSSLANQLPRHSKYPVVRVRYFSAVAAFNILGMAGVKKVRTLGIDGGTEYASGMDSKDKLSNGRTSFDIQFREIKSACRRYRMKVVMLGEGKEE